MACDISAPELTSTGVLVLDISISIFLILQVNWLAIAAQPFLAAHSAGDSRCFLYAKDIADNEKKQTIGITNQTQANAVFSSFHELMQSCGIRHPSVCLSICKDFAQIASSTRQMAGSPPKLHTKVPRRACIQGVLKVKVEVKGYVIRTLLLFHENRFFSQANGWIATKLVHDGSQPSLHPGCAQGQGRGQRSRDMGTSVMSRNVCYTVQSHVLPLHVLTLWSTITLSF